MSRLSEWSWEYEADNKCDFSTNDECIMMYEEDYCICHPTDARAIERFRK